MAMLNIFFIWVSFLSSCATFFSYATQRWWATNIGRFLIILQTALVISYLGGIIRTIVARSTIRTDTLSVVFAGIVACILAYGAFAFITTIRGNGNNDH